MAVLAEEWRGPLAENLHRGDGAVVDAAGRLLFAVGNPAKVSYWRSAAKPFQAMAVVASGAASGFGLGPKHLAIFAGSHNGEPAHVGAVTEALHLTGLSAEQLQCGLHRPFDRESARAQASASVSPLVEQNNCSGKHTGMLATARFLGLPTANYLESDSPLQRLILPIIAAATGVPSAGIPIGVEGCGVPAYGLTVQAMAAAYARLADPDTLPDSVALSESVALPDSALPNPDTTARRGDLPPRLSGLAAAAREVRDAMLRFPYMLAGRKRLCTDLTGLPGRRFVAKSGADGIYCVGVLPEAAALSPVLQGAAAVGGVGIAVKSEDGNERASLMAAVEILRQLGLLNAADLTALAQYQSRLITNLAGRVVGEFRPVFTIERV